MKILKVLARAYSAPEHLDGLISFYECLFGEPCAMRLPLPGLGLEVAAVGAIHLLAGAEDKLQRFRPANATFWVDSVTGAEQELKLLGATTLAGPERGPGGSYMIAKHPDGLVVEYIDQADRRSGMSVVPLLKRHTYVMGRFQEGSKDTIPGAGWNDRDPELKHTACRALLTAYLLTGCIHQAERAMYCALDSFDPDRDTKETLFRQVLRAAIHPAEPVRRPVIKERGPLLPGELEAVLNLSSEQRQCFVLRWLVGMSERDCARLLRLHGGKVCEHTCAAMQALAGFSPC
jgi:hypothetical protein